MQGSRVKVENGGEGIKLMESDEDMVDDNCLNGENGGKLQG